MASSDNLVVHITLPAGLRQVDGAVLAQDITFDVVSRLTPYYASVDQVRLEGGMYIRKLQDLTIASKIYAASQEAGSFCLHPPTDLTSDQARIYNFALNQWVQNKAALDLMLNISGLLNQPGGHVLANFSVTRGRNLDLEGVQEKLTDLKRDIALWEPSLRSCGRTIQGGHPAYHMAAKGVMDWSEKTPGRTWVVTGMGANAKSFDFGSPTGGRGKPSSFYYATYYSPPIISYRQGIYQAAYPLVVVNPWQPTV